LDQGFAAVKAQGNGRNGGQIEIDSQRTKQHQAEQEKEKFLHNKNGTSE
jgi:hypothetical protein